MACCWHFVRLCRQLDRPVTEAELRAAATLPEGGVDLACLTTIAARLGFAVRTLRMSPRRAGWRPHAVPDPGSPARRGVAGAGSHRRPAGTGRAGARPRHAMSAGDRRRASATGWCASAPGAARGSFWRSRPMRGVRGRAVADRPRVGGDQPAGAGNATVHDDRLQQGHQSRARCRRWTCWRSGW